jgi:Fur family transcriptional regulator, ferric uptake regulator
MAKKSGAREEMNVPALKEQIRSAGLKWTAARGAVLDLMSHSERPLSHGEIVELVAQRGFDRATVYRNLIDLTAAGLLTRADLGDHVWRFELKDGDEDGVHPHFMCTDCGAVSCLPDSVIATKGMAQRANVGSISEVLLKGSCATCA